MDKRGQVTIFIIVSVLIVASVALFFVFRENPNKTETISADGETEEKTESIRSDVEYCLDDAGASSIYFVSQYGGTFPPNEPNLNGIPYYSYNNDLTFPGRTEIESSLEDYFEGALANCLSNFSESLGENASKDDIETEVKVLEDRVNFDANYPVLIEGRGQARRIEEFSSSVNIKLGQIHEISKFIANEHVGSDRQSLCLTCLERETNGTGLDIQSFFGPENNSKLYVIIDERAIGAREIPQSEDEPLRYMFAVKY